jgi:hypothetical protein
MNARVNSSEVGDLVSAGGSGFKDNSQQIRVSSLGVFLIDELLVVWLLWQMKPLPLLPSFLMMGLCSLPTVGVLMLDAHYCNQSNSIIMLPNSVFTSLEAEITSA